VATGLGRVALIVNPVAGGGRALRVLPRVLASLREVADVRLVHVTAAPGEATGVAAVAAAEGFEAVVAVGGDGTINEVANGLVCAGAAVPLGVVPAGRGADFVRSLGLPRNVDAALAHLRVAAPRPIDVGRAVFADGGSRIFVNVAGVGFDAEVAASAARSRLPGATAPYLSGVAAGLRRARPRPVAVEVDGGEIVGETLAVIVANGHSFGGGLRIAPGARPDDGLLDVAVVGDVSPLDLLRQVPRVYRGAHVDHPKFALRPGRAICIEAPETMRVQLDGEVVGAAPVAFAIETGALLVLA